MSRKPFDVQDKGLWDEVRKSVSPLTRRKAEAKPDSAKKLGGAISSKPATVPASHYPKLRPTRDIAPPLAGFDRRTAQRLTRGQIEPEAKLDLHGETLETARIKLLHFLANQRHRGLRFVLVVTGKGASPFARHTLHGASHFHTPEREGRLRREVPLWLHEETFRIHTIGMQPAHPRHGGGGAFYVKLRRSLHPTDFP